MPPPKRSDDEVPLTVRTAHAHREVLDALAASFGISRSDMVGIVLADALGLERPVGKPVIALAPNSLPALAHAEVQQAREEVMRPTA